MPEAIPTEKIKESAFDKIKSAVFRKKTAIQEIVREPTSGGIVFRFTKDKKDIEILLIQDSKERWTIPKGHIEPGETAKVTARREIEEETGLANISVLTWLGKIHFKYRRADKLVNDDTFGATQLIVCWGGGYIHRLPCLLLKLFKGQRAVVARSG